MKFLHPIHGECELVDKRTDPENSKTLLFRRGSDGAILYLSTNWVKAQLTAETQPEPTPPEATA